MPQKLWFSQHFCEKPDSETLFFLLSQPCWWQNLVLIPGSEYKADLFFLLQVKLLSNFFQKKMYGFRFLSFHLLQLTDMRVSLHIIKWLNFRALGSCCWSHIIKAKETAHKMFLKSTSLGVSSPNPCVSLAFF